MKIKELFSSHHKWTKYGSAKNNKGESVRSCDLDATRFCLSGAVSRCYPNVLERIKILKKLKSSIEKYTGEKYSGITNFNDSSSFKDVKNVVEQANV